MTTDDRLARGCGECQGWPGHHPDCSKYGIPRTEAGAELLRMLEDSIYKGGGLRVGRDAIFAIEDEAEVRAATRVAPSPDAPDWERLAQAYAEAGYGPVLTSEEWADIAYEYAALDRETPA